MCGGAVAIDVSLVRFESERCVQLSYGMLISCIVYIISAWPVYSYRVYIHIYIYIYIGALSPRNWRYPEAATEIEVTG